jgi:hypothetical protein
MISWQGFEQEDDLIGFWGNETTIFLNDVVASSGVDNSHMGSKGGDIRQNDNLVPNSCSKVQSRQGDIKKRLDDAYKIMSRCIVFGSPVASSYEQSSSITSEQEKTDNDANSVLTATSSQ